MPKKANKEVKKTTKARKTWSCSNHRKGDCDVFRERKVPDHRKTQGGAMICKSCNPDARMGFINEDPIAVYGSKAIAAFAYYHNGDMQIALRDPETNEAKGVKKFSIKFKKNGDPILSGRGAYFAERRNDMGQLEQAWVPQYRRQSLEDVMALDVKA